MTKTAPLGAALYSHRLAEKEWQQQCIRLQVKGIDRYVTFATWSGFVHMHIQWWVYVLILCMCVGEGSHSLSNNMTRILRGPLKCYFVWYPRVLAPGLDVIVHLVVDLQGPT